MRIPVLETERLVLRGFTAEDFDGFAAIWADPVVTERIGVPARDRAESWSAFLKIAGGWTLLGYSQWAICDRETGALWGQTGFFQAMRGHGAPFDDHPEAGWVLAAEAMGRGLGPEAAGAAHDWFDARVGGPTVCQIDATNGASQAVAARLGYRQFAEIGRPGSADHLYLYRRG